MTHEETDLKLSVLDLIALIFLSGGFIMLILSMVAFLTSRNSASVLAPIIALVAVLIALIVAGLSSIPLARSSHRTLAGIGAWVQLGVGGILLLIVLAMLVLALTGGLLLPEAILMAVMLVVGSVSLAHGILRLQSQTGPDS